MTKRSISYRLLAFLVVLAMVLTVTAERMPVVLAEGEQIGYVNGVNVHIREDAGTQYSSLGKLTYVQVVILGSKNDNQGREWKHVKYNNIVGYMFGEYITILENNTQTDQTFEQQIAAFPEDYKAALRQLHGTYPNWTFEADFLSVTFDETIDAQEKFPKKLVPYSDPVSYRSMTKNAYDWANNVWEQTEGTWVGASREVIAYYMDPRNFLNFNDIYMFADQTYNRVSHTRQGVETIVAGTFLAENFGDSSDYNGSYVDIIMAAAEQTGISPYMVAATIRQEHAGAPNGGLISGNQPGYEGYYNFFNIGATGSDSSQIIANGLNYARNKGWNSRSKSIIGGAQFLAGSYFSQGQNTYYYKNFDVRTGNFSHQYAQNIYDTKSSSASLRKVFVGDANAQLHFVIPVYKNMWATPAPKPEENNKRNNYYFTGLGVSGFDMYKENYSLSITGNHQIDYNLPEGATYTGAQTINLAQGANRVVLEVKAETGAVNHYVLNINAAVACTLTINGLQAPIPSFPKGDINADNNVNGLDSALLRLHILGRKSLASDQVARADVNGDGNINGLDSALIRLHILGRRPLS